MLLSSLFAVLLVTIEAITWEKVSIYLNVNDTFDVVIGTTDPSADVEAYFIDTLETTGWGQLQVQINNNNHNKDSITDKQRSYASGYAEGMLTAQRIHEQYNNMYVSEFWNFTDGPSPQLLDWMKQQREWKNDMISKHPDSDYWKMVQIIEAQIEGLWNGYNYYAQTFKTIPYQNSSWIFHFFQLMPDLMDLQNVFNITSRMNYTNCKCTPSEYYRYLMKRNHCSAVIKVSPVLDDIYFGHTTWMVFQMMNRIYKHYIFNYNELFEQKSVHQSFSSYPGVIGSQDDYYMSDTMVLLQTTNSIIDTSLYDLLTPHSLWYYERIRIANQLSSTGEEWYNYFKRYNSGTYNNQYMLLNYHLFTVNETLKEDTLWIVEQIPGLVLGEDVTNVLERGYWASYNIPAIAEIYNKSGYPQLVNDMGVQFSYDLAPRARIFRRDANGIKDLEGVKAFLRYNNYENDEIENDDPTWAIAARVDLLNSSIMASPFGGYDSKCANYSMLMNMETIAINGPTQSKANPNGEELKPFSWSDWPQYANVHQGIPDIVDFDWQLMKKLF